MEHQEEKTVLLSSDNSTASSEKVSVSDDDFTVVLKEVCGDHMIITSIYALTYRVEVFVEGALEDATETLCEISEKDPQRESLFRSAYMQAHQKYKEKICHKVDTLIPKKDANVKRLENTDEENGLQEQLNEGHIHWVRKELVSIYKKLKHSIQKRGYNHQVILLGILFGVLIFLGILGRMLMCNETAVTLFLKPSEREAYYKQTESFCHTLENRCINLTQMNLEQETSLSPEVCRSWCQEKIIPKEKCELFLPYFPKKKEAQPLSEEFEEPIQKSKIKGKEKAYLFIPQGNIILKPQNDFELLLENHMATPLVIRLKEIILQESAHEEIVQFRAGVISLSIQPDSTKSFKIFLEKTYYEQFEKGEYHGTLHFSLLLSKGKEQKIEKLFSFKVR